MVSYQRNLMLLDILNGLLLLIGISSAMLPSKEKTWTYEFKSMESQTSDPALFNIDFKVEKISRGVYSMSGTLSIDYDIVEGDDSEVEAHAYRSDTGSSEYKMLPFKMNRQHFFDALNGFYKDMAMDTLKECSDMPVFEDKFIPPFEKKTYTLNKCQFKTDNFPNHLPDGYYKIILKGYGKVEWTCEIIVQVEQKN